MKDNFKFKKKKKFLLERDISAACFYVKISNKNAKKCHSVYSQYLTVYVLNPKPTVFFIIIRSKLGKHYSESYI